MHTKPTQSRAGTRTAEINVITLGCSKNLVDTEVMLGQLQASGLAAVHEGATDAASTVVINTCGFIDNAKEESIQTILDYVRRKEAGEVERVYVTGCLSERYRDELKVEIPEVDGYFGTQDLPDLLSTLGADYRRELVGERKLTGTGHYAYLKISEGCDRPCSFCAIPLMRGKHRSRSLESLVEEAHFLAQRGVKELILIAQDLTYYGLDLYKKRRLYDLLDALSQVAGIEWVRLHYAYPSGFPTEILPLVAERPTLCNYLDIPLQHIADPVLKAMRRGITEAKTRELIHHIRQQVPGIALRTTLLVGHPGETEADHRALMSFVEEMRFERLGVFTYSHEEGTHAHQYADSLPQDAKEARAEEVMALQQQISAELNQQRIGQQLRVLIDRQEGEWYIGRTEYDSPEVDNEVLITGANLQAGSFYLADIYDATEFDLFATVPGHPARTA
ncbi:MAG: 30S ribosomal protein S12 methylthiotransferase RimO [Sphingobacteriia bacterium]